MKEVILHVPDNKFQAFIKFIQSIPYITLERISGKTNTLTSKQKQLADNIQEGLEEVERHRQGKIKLQSAKAFLDEL